MQWTADAAIVTTRRMPDHPRPASGSFVQLAGILSDWWADWLVGFVSGVRLTDSSQFQLTEAGREVYGVVTGWYTRVVTGWYAWRCTPHADLGTCFVEQHGSARPNSARAGRASRTSALQQIPITHGATSSTRTSTEDTRAAAARRGAAAAHVRQGARKAAAGGRARCGVGTA